MCYNRFTVSLKGLDFNLQVRGDYYYMKEYPDLTEVHDAQDLDIFLKRRKRAKELGMHKNSITISKRDIKHFDHWLSTSRPDALYQRFVRRSWPLIKAGIFDASKHHESCVKLLFKPHTDLFGRLNLLLIIQAEGQHHIYPISETNVLTVHFNELKHLLAPSFEMPIRTIYYKPSHDYVEPAIVKLGPLWQLNRQSAAQMFIEYFKQLYVMPLLKVKGFKWSECVIDSDQKAISFTLNLEQLV